MLLLLNYLLYLCRCIVAAANVVVTNGWRKKAVVQTSWT